jgi:hypothetical protein
MAVIAENGSWDRERRKRRRRKISQSGILKHHIFSTK